MICKKCNEQISDENKVCPKCGADLTEKTNKTVIPEENVQIEEVKDTEDKANSNKSKTIITVFVVIAVIVAASFAISKYNNSKQKELLAESIQGEWYIVQDTLQNILYFTEDTVEYGVDSDWLGYFHFLDGNYEVISGNQIQSDLYKKIETYTVEFNDNRTEVSITPSLTGRGNITETWTKR